MRLPLSLTPHTVTIERYQAAGTYGEGYEAPATLRAVKVEERQAVRRHRDGTEIVCKAVVTCRPEHLPLPLKSRMTLPSGTVGVVVDIEHLNHRPAPAHSVAYLE